MPPKKKPASWTPQQAALLHQGFRERNRRKQINQIIKAVPSIFQALQPFSVLRKAGLRQTTTSFILITRTKPVSTLLRNPEVALALAQKVRRSDYLFRCRFSTICPVECRRHNGFAVDLSVSRIFLLFKMTVF
jgi:hypothetical protein